MKKCLLFIILLLYIISNENIYANTDLTCTSSILIDGKTGRVLYEENMNRKIYPASLTKLLTALTALDIGELDDVLVVDDKTPYEIDGSHIALEPEERLTLEDLLHGLLIASGNDAAEVIAKNYSTYEGEFIELMNEKAKALGAVNSNFVNPHGLHDDNHYSTAYDLSRIALAAHYNDIISNIVNKTKYTIEKTNIKEEERNLISTNRLLVGMGYGNQIIIDDKWVNMKYDGATGMKTGYTPEAGSCLIGSAHKNNIDLITVVIKGNTVDVYTDTHKLLNYGFDLHKNINLVNENELIDNIKITSGDSKFLSLVSTEDCNALVKKDEVDEINQNIELNGYSLPIKKGDILGYISFNLGDESVGKVPLKAAFSVDKIIIEETNLTLFALKSIISFILFIILIIFILRMVNKFRVYKIRKGRNNKYL